VCAVEGVLTALRGATGRGSNGGMTMNSTATKDVIGLAEEGAADPARSGSKAAALAALAARGFRCPPPSW
jgi:hypothetical protein